MRPLPGTRALRTFEAAGRHLNFTHAANELGLTPAAVSHQIKEMEAQLGVSLFQRHSRSIRLTAAGEILWTASQAALALLQQAAHRARQTARDRTQLRLSLGARFATNWLLPRLSSLKTKHPDLELSLDVTDELRDFTRDDIDVAIRFGTGCYAGSHAIRLFTTQVIPVCRPELLTHSPQPLTPQDLTQYTLCYVDCKVEGLVWPNWPMWMAAAGVADFDDRHCVAFAESSHVVQAVLEGSAVGLVESAMVAKELAQGRLVTPFDISVQLGGDFAYYVVYPQTAEPNPALLALRDWLLAEAQPPAPSKNRP